MDIIKRNFLRLMRSGAYNDYEPIEPMSIYKWKKLAGIVVVQNVIPIAANAIHYYTKDNVSNIPKEILDDFKSLYNEKEMSSKITIPQSILTNSFLNKRLEKIRYNELHSIDTSLETLELFNILIYNTNKIITQGITYCNILLIGKYLRSKGNRVDFIKLEKWLQRLNIQDMTQFEGSILITTLNFEQNEVPFVHKIDNTAYTRALNALEHRPSSNLKNQMLFTQGQSGLLYNNTAVLRNNIWNKMKYLSYAPIETTSNFIHNIVNSLSEIEE